MEAIGATAAVLFGLYVLGGFIYLFATRANFSTIGKFFLSIFILAGMVPVLIFFSAGSMQLQGEEAEQMEEQLLTTLPAALLMSALFAWLWYRARSPKKDWVDDPATPRQLAYISALMDEREVEEPIMEPATKGEASRLIEELKLTPVRSDE